MVEAETNYNIFSTTTIQLFFNATNAFNSWYTTLVSKANTFCPRGVNCQLRVDNAAAIRDTAVSAYNDYLTLNEQSLNPQISDYSLNHHRDNFLRALLPLELPPEISFILPEPELDIFNDDMMLETDPAIQILLDDNQTIVTTPAFITPQPQQDNTLRNVLLIGGALLLL